MKRLTQFTLALLAGLSFLPQAGADPPPNEVVKDRKTFIPYRKYVALPGKAVGILLHDGQPVLSGEGRSGPSTQLVFGMGGCSYRWVYVPVPPPGQIQNLQVPIAKGGVKVYPLLDIAKPQNVGLWNVTRPYSLVEVEVNDGLGSPVNDSFVASSMKVLDGTREYPLKMTDVVADLRKKYARYKTDQAKVIEAALADAQKKALKDRKNTGPRTEEELMYLSWMPETKRLRAHFRTRISDGAYTYVEGGGIRPPFRLPPMKLPPPPPAARGGAVAFPPPPPPRFKIKTGTTFGIEFGRGFDVDRKGEIVATQSLPIQAFQSETNPRPGIRPGPMPVRP